MGERIQGFVAALSSHHGKGSIERRKFPGLLSLPDEADQYRRALLWKSTLVWAGTTFVPSVISSFDSENASPLNGIIQEFANKQRDRFWSVYKRIHSDTSPQPVMSLNLKINNSDHIVEVTQKTHGTTMGDTESISFTNEFVEIDGGKSVVIHKLALDSSGNHWYCSAQKFMDGKEEHDDRLQYPYYTSTNPDDSKIKSGEGYPLTLSAFWGTVNNFIQQDMNLFLQAL